MIITVVLVCVLVLFITFSGVLSSSETALFSLSAMKVRAYKLGRDPRGHTIAKLLKRPRDLLVTILMLNVLMNILIQNVVSSLFGTFSGFLLTVGVPLFLTLVFGEVIPKYLAISKNAAISIRVAPSLYQIGRFLGPIRVALTYITSFISRVLFCFLKQAPDISLEEMKLALRTSRKYGVLNPEEAKLVRGYLNLEEDLIKELMVPRQEIISYNIQEPIEVLIRLFVEEQCTRIPVYDAELENIQGVITSGQFFIYREEIESGADLGKYLVKPFFIPETTTGKSLLRQFYEKEETLAIVVDEYGSISGIITLEDLVELVAGQIVGQRDEKSLYTKAGEDVIIASGKLEVTEFEEIFDFHLESPNNMATLGGWLTEQIGDIPKGGEKYVTKEFLFHILAADPNRVRRVYIRKLKASSKKKVQHGEP